MNRRVILVPSRVLQSAILLEYEKQSGKTIGLDENAKVLFSVEGSGEVIEERIEATIILEPIVNDAQGVFQFID